jgi:uncharacterized membrane protein YebE (DUF533 family)
MSAIAFGREAAHEIARALAAVAAADGAIVAREASQLDEFAVVHGVGVQIWIASPLDPERLAAAVPDADQRRQALRLCLRMAVADGTYAAPEQAIIARIAAAFAIPGAELRALESSVGLSRPPPS